MPVGGRSHFPIVFQTPLIAPFHSILYATRDWHRIEECPAPTSTCSTTHLKTNQATSCGMKGLIRSCRVSNACRGLSRFRFHHFPCYFFCTLTMFQIPTGKSVISFDVYLVAKFLRAENVILVYQLNIGTDLTQKPYKLYPFELLADSYLDRYVFDLVFPVRG